MNGVTFIPISIWFIAKIFVIIALIVYVVFALVVVRQVQLMSRTVEVGFEIPIKMLVLAHLIFAIGVLFLALTIL